MITLVCPHCNVAGVGALANITFVVYSTVRVEVNDGALVYSVPAPVDARDPSQSTGVTAGVTELCCTACGRISPIEEWRATVVCESCGSVITCGMHPERLHNIDDDLAGFINAHKCMDGGNSTRCVRCWRRHDMEYCPRCRFGDTCEALAHYTAELERNSGSPPPQRRRRLGSRREPEAPVQVERPTVVDIDQVAAALSARWSNEPSIELDDEDDDGGDI